MIDDHQKIIHLRIIVLHRSSTTSALSHAYIHNSLSLIPSNHSILSHDEISSRNSPLFTVTQKPSASVFATFCDHLVSFLPPETLLKTVVIVLLV